MSQSVCKHFHNENGLVRTRTLCHRKDGWLWHGQQEDRDHAGFAAVDDEAVAAEAPLFDPLCIERGQAAVGCLRKWTRLGSAG